MSRDYRKAALRAWLKERGEKITPSLVQPYWFTPHAYFAGSRQYQVLTEREANRQCVSNIKEVLWTFNPDFLAAQTGLSKRLFEVLVSQQESFSEDILRLIELTCGLDKFVKAAIEADGRGSFLAHYDGYEGEHGRYFIYRIA